MTSSPSYFALTLVLGVAVPIAPLKLLAVFGTRIRSWF